MPAPAGVTGEAGYLPLIVKSPSIVKLPRTLLLSPVEKNAPIVPESASTPPANVPPTAVISRRMALPSESKYNLSANSLVVSARPCILKPSDGLIYIFFKPSDVVRFTPFSSIVNVLLAFIILSASPSIKLPINTSDAMPYAESAVPGMSISPSASLQVSQLSSVIYRPLLMILICLGLYPSSVILRPQIPNWSITID